MPKPRLIFVNRVYPPSTEATAQLLGDLTMELAARGWPVHVIAAGDSSPTAAGPVTVHRTGGRAQKGGAFRRLAGYVRFLRQARRILQAMMQPRDIVIVMTDPPMVGTWLASVVRQRQGQLVHWIQDIYPEILRIHLGGWSGPLLWPLQRCRDTAWTTASACVTLGSEMAATLSSSGVPADRIQIIPNWAPRELDQLPEADAIVAQRVTWEAAAKFVVAYSGNLGRVHEFLTLIQAAELLRDQPDVTFLFIGNGARFAEVKKAVTQKNLSNVRFLPAAPREKLAVSLAAADLHLVSVNPDFSRLVYPSKLAGVLAVGRPVALVASPQSELAHVLEKNRCGCTAAPGDGAGLAQFILQCSRNADTRNLMGRSARAVYEREYALSTAVLRWEQLFQKLVGR